MTLEYDFADVEKRRQFLREKGGDPNSKQWREWTREEAKLDLISFAFALEDEFLFSTLTMAKTMYDWQMDETGVDTRPDALAPKAS